MNDLVEAWTLWFSGGITQDFTLWGKNLVYWGRIGKSIQFIAFLTIIAEIIGQARLKRWGNNLRAGITLSGMVQHLRRSYFTIAIGLHAIFIASLNIFFQIMEDLARIFKKDTKAIEDRILNRLKPRLEKATSFIERTKKDEISGTIYWMYLFLILVAIILAIAFYPRISLYDLIFLQRGVDAWWIRAIVSIFQFPINILVFYFAPALFLFVLNFTWAAIRLLVYVILYPVSWLLGLQAIDNFRRITSLILMIIGFQFDLLAS